MATLNFNANTVEPSSDFEAIPPGKYLAAITESEMKPTRSAQGQYLQLTFQLLDGPYKGRYLWARLNLQNPNPTTVQIARGELSAICRACGVMTPQDSVELHNIPLVVHVKVKKRSTTTSASSAGGRSSAAGVEHSAKRSARSWPLRECGRWPAACASVPTCTPPDRRRRDVDNTLKALLDALEHGGAYVDDAQIVWLLTQKAQVVRGGKVIVRIWQRGACPQGLDIATDQQRRATSCN